MSAADATLRYSPRNSEWVKARREEFAAGTVAAERVVDGLVITLMLTTALWFSTPLSPLPTHLGTLPLPMAVEAASSKIVSLPSAGQLVPKLSPLVPRFNARLTVVLSGPIKLSRKSPSKE